MALAQVDLQNYLKLAQAVQKIEEQRSLWMSYDAEADVLYINFYYPPKTATESEVTDDDVVIRYENDEVIGLTILSVQTR